MSSPPPTDQPFAALHETHSGVVFLLGDRVYKAKKPIRTEFLDFRTRAARRAVCAREVELNRRMAPDVYLGVVELGDPGADGNGGAAGEPLVVMRRMPEAARLSTLVRRGGCEDVVAEIAGIVARFHAHARRGADVDAQGTAAATRRRWMDNLRETRELDSAIIGRERLAAIERAVLRYLDGRSVLFAGRLAAGRIVDGHGDLLADDIFRLDDGPRILDCLEFDDRLRCVDGLDDISCLAMDLEFLERPDLAAALFERYAAAARDPAPASLRHHYVAYRAFMRAKVDCVRHLQGRARSADDARRHTTLAEQHLTAGTVRMALVGGLPATGKSSLARVLADTVGAVLMSSDAVRRDLFADQRTRDPDPGFGRGRYSEESTDRVYGELLARAGEALSRGESVVLDASWTDGGRRGRAAVTAAAHLADLVPIHCTAPPDVTERRLRERAVANPGHDSEATPDVAAAMARRADPWPDAARIDTSRQLQAAAAAAARHWHRHP